MLARENVKDTCYELQRFPCLVQYMSGAQPVVVINDAELSRCAYARYTAVFLCHSSMRRPALVVTCVALACSVLRALHKGHYGTAYSQQSKHVKLFCLFWAQADQPTVKHATCVPGARKPVQWQGG